MKQIIEEFRVPRESLRREMAKMQVDPVQDFIRQQKVIEAELRSVHSAVQPPMTINSGLVRTDERMLVRFTLPKDDISFLREELADLRALIEQTK